MGTSWAEAAGTAIKGGDEAAEALADAARAPGDAADTSEPSGNPPICLLRARGRQARSLGIAGRT
jgi:hypothetical protein